MGQPFTIVEPNHDNPASPSHLRVVPWPDPVIESVGYEVRSLYVETFWLPVLGPTSTWLLRRLVGELDGGDDGVMLDVLDAARSLGVGGPGGKNSPFARALQRCVTFEAARRYGDDTVAVRRFLPALPRRHLVRLTPRQQRRHEAWSLAASRVTTFESERRRARVLALGLADLDHDPEAMAIQLLRWGVHPALADDAVRWVRGRSEDGTHGRAAVSAPAKLAPVP